MKIKTLFSNISLSVLLLTCFSRPTFASKDRPIIGLTIDSFDTPRWQKDRDNIVRAVEKLGGIAVVKSAQSSDAIQIASIRTFIDIKVDAIVVVAHSGIALVDVIKQAHQAHIPVICYDRLIRDADIACFIGFDNMLVGELQAKYILDKLPTDHKARIVRILGSEGDPNSLLYKQGQDRILAPELKEGKIEIVHEGWAVDWAPAAAKKIMSEALSAGGQNIDAVLASNDNLAGAALEAIAESGANIRPIITGQDADRAACVRIEDGTQTMTVYKPLDKLAALAGKVATSIAKGEPPETSIMSNNGQKDVPTFMSPITVVDKDNLASTVIADGFLRGY